MLVRIHCLFQLSLLYVEQFGIPFEKRHAYRNQLFSVLSGKHNSIADAHKAAREQYAETNGKGIPLTMDLALGGAQTV